MDWLTNTLEQVSAQQGLATLQPLINEWHRELDESGNGCSFLKLDPFLSIPEVRVEFEQAMQSVLAKIGPQMPQVRRLAEQIVIFVVQGYESLEPIFRGEQPT